ncbi:stage II sporulation protein D [uncultured Pseudoflavonifractor sp.]|uniref:stage II sporulation protein D n=1 Tax=uncultured Pseudoflavonifractor sp. TaxID=1221379 RepID=UPI0025F3B6DC|nr:stage II sporulation protein D [uncultured Pseudoflavonifractor sp.]
MRKAAAAGLGLLALLFLMPLLFLGGKGEAVDTPEPTGTLPLDRTVVSPPPAEETGADETAALRVKLPDGTVTEMTMADYLWRVVAAEMPASFEPEALKAQAVAARTYAAAKMAAGESNHPDADVCTDINCCQAYITPQEAEDNWGESAADYEEKISAAVADTDGVIATYGGQPIQAVFFSSAAGRTADAVEVWGNDVPYLTGVESPEGEEVPNYHSTVAVPLEEFRTALLSQAPGADLSGDPSGWFGTPVLGSNGGVVAIPVGGEEVTGATLRALFNLRSTVFTVQADSTAVTFSVTGYGHGVGMSQYGANAMAKAGKRYEEIIKWYYTGVELEQMSE